ncbi:MAG: hypothetical protein JMDDDDMK_05633 [Acidobacteria bacterium]|nr:hypothetical protein [Acidobacteriota bacterium]
MHGDSGDFSLIAEAAIRFDRQLPAGRNRMQAVITERGRRIRRHLDRQRRRPDPASVGGGLQRETRVSGPARRADQRPDRARAIHGQTRNRHAVDGRARAAIDRHLRPLVFHLAELQKAPGAARRIFSGRRNDGHWRAGPRFKEIRAMRRDNQRRAQQRAGSDTYFVFRKIHDCFTPSSFLFRVAQPFTESSPSPDSTPRHPRATARPLRRARPARRTQLV